MRIEETSRVEESVKENTNCQPRPNIQILLVIDGPKPPRPSCIKISQMPPISKKKDTNIPVQPTSLLLHSTHKVMYVARTSTGTINLCRMSSNSSSILKIPQRTSQLFPLSIPCCCSLPVCKSRSGLIFPSSSSCSLVLPINLLRPITSPKTKSFCSLSSQSRTRFFSTLVIIPTGRVWCMARYLM